METPISISVTEADKQERVCALEAFKECSKPFVPNRPNQICCCYGHNKRLRYLRRKERVKRALEAVEKGL